MGKTQTRKPFLDFFLSSILISAFLAFIKIISNAEIANRQFKKSNIPYRILSSDLYEKFIVKEQHFGILSLF